MDWDLAVEAQGMNLGETNGPCFTDIHNVICINAFWQLKPHT